RRRNGRVDPTALGLPTAAPMGKKTATVRNRTVAGITMALVRTQRRMRWRFRCSLSEILSNEIPVDQVPERLNVFRASIAVVDIVSMLPNVTSQQRRLAAR